MLGIAALGEGGEADQVREQDAHEAALRAEAGAGRRRVGRRHAVVAHACPALAAELRGRGEAGTAHPTRRAEGRPAFRAESGARVVRRATVGAGQAIPSNAPTAGRVSDRPSRTLGASAYSRDTGIERLMRDTKGAQIPRDDRNVVHRSILADSVTEAA